MRITVDENEAGRLIDTAVERFDVLLDGVKQDMVITADDGEGYIVKHVLNDNGSVYIDCATGEPYRQVVYGNVEIVPL